MILHDRNGSPSPIYCEGKCKKKSYCRLKYRLAAKYCENKEDKEIEQDKTACDETGSGA
jgi:hypothetical protein